MNWSHESTCGGLRVLRVNGEAVALTGCSLWLALA
jgi:hypothetical protein